MISGFKNLSVFKSVPAFLAFFSLIGCSSAKPPPPPSNSAYSDVRDGEEQDRVEDEKEEEKEDGGPFRKVSDSEGDDGEIGAPERPTRSREDVKDTGGADIGDEKMKEALKACHEEFKFFDRFSSLTGDCTDVDLAFVDCTVIGIRRDLSSGLKKQFDESLLGSYKGWDVDQCIDCPPDGDSAACTSSQGGSQEGTKVFFVQESSGEIRGKAIVIPLRIGRE